jgi:hypothetical protein
MGALHEDKRDELEDIVLKQLAAFISDQVKDEVESSMARADGLFTRIHKKLADLERRVQALESSSQEVIQGWLGVLIPGEKRFKAISVN